MAVVFPVAENTLNSPQLLNKSSLRRLYDGFQCSFQVESMTNTSKEFKNSEVVHMISPQMENILLQDTSKCNN